MKMFSGLHPVTSAVFFITVLVPTLFLSSPPLLVLSLVGGVLCLALLGGLARGRALVFPLLLTAVCALTTPLFSHRGATELFFVNGGAYTLEAVLNGAVTGLSLSAAVVWCMSAAIILTDEKTVYLIGGRAPKTALVLSSSLRMLPEAHRRYKEIRDTQRLLGRFDDEKFIPHCRSQIAVWSALIGQLLEDSRTHTELLVTRCGGSLPRAVRHYRYGTADIVITAAAVLCGMAVLVPAALGAYDVSFYPTFRASLSPRFWAAPAALCFLPAITILTGELKWKYSKSKT